MILLDVPAARMPMFDTATAMKSPFTGTCGMLLVGIVVCGAPWFMTEKMEIREFVPHIKLRNCKLR